MSLIPVLVVACGWVLVRLLLVLPLGNRAGRLHSETEVPFLPSGRAKAAGEGAGLGCLFFILSLAAGAALGVVLIVNSRPNAKPLDLLMPCIAFGIIGAVAGVWFEMFVSRQERAIARSQQMERFSQLSEWVNGTPQEQMWAAEVVGAICDLARGPEVTAHLLPGLQSPNGQVRYRTAVAVMAVAEASGVVDPAVAPTLRELLGDKEVKVRAPAARALAASGLLSRDSAAPPLASALSSEDRSAWGLVTWYFDRPGTCLHQALPEVFAAVSQHGGALQRSGLSLCFRWIDRMARPELEAAARHPNEFVRAVAEEALGRLKSPRKS